MSQLEAGDMAGGPPRRGGVSILVLLPVLLLVLGATGCTLRLFEEASDAIAGEMTIARGRFRVTVCGTDDSYELRLSTSQQVHVGRLYAEASDDGRRRVLVELRGKAYPPTQDIAPTRVFELHRLERIEPGACP